jgi:N-acetylglucosamine-6-phosphate deacetylase
MIVLTNARVVTADGVLTDGWVQVDGTRIAAAGNGTAPPGDALDLAGAWLLPGFIDIHVHGGGGHDVASTARDLAAAVAFHRSHGTTRTLISLAAAPLDDLARQLGWIADLVASGPSTSGHVVGAHLEGPFLSPERRGAQNPANLLLPDRETFAELLAAARGTLRCITIAPELPGALDLIADAVAAEVVAAIGHSDATYAEAVAGVEAGASLATHLCNGMRPFDHREPGVVLAALDRLTCEVINDGLHVHPMVTALVARDPGRLVLVTDAMGAAGAGDGEFTLGDQIVTVLEGEARLPSGSLAGSTLTMDVALRRAVLDSGLSIEAASAAASGNPARVLNLADSCGRIAAGLDADLVVLDADLRLQRVMSLGAWC